VRLEPREDGQRRVAIPVVPWGVVDLLLYFFLSKIVSASGADLHGAPSYFAVAGVLASLIVASATQRSRHGFARSS
jgi:hypothetical protein